MPSERTADVEKSGLRSRFSGVRAGITQADRCKKNQKLAEHLLQWVVNYPPASERRMRSQGLTIGLYSSFRAEADISLCFMRLQALGHTVVYPKTDKQTKELAFHQVIDLDDLRVGNYGIHEPLETAPLVLSEHIGVICVPGLAFTTSGVRLGYGGGFYDRFFGGDRMGTIRIGIAYSVQVTHSLPDCPHDARMDYLVTEEGWMECLL